MTTLAESFSTRLRELEARAKAAGSNLTQVCKKSGIARATVERWMDRPPQTITKFDEIEAVVSQLEAAAKGES